MPINAKQVDPAPVCLETLRQIAEAATPGPWIYFAKPKYGEHHVTLPIVGSSMRTGLFEDGCRTDRSEADARFIAAANPAVILDLLNRLEAVEGRGTAGGITSTSTVSSGACRICRGTGENQSGLGACEWCKATAKIDPASALKAVAAIKPVAAGGSSFDGDEWNAAYTQAVQAGLTGVVAFLRRMREKQPEPETP